MSDSENGFGARFNSSDIAAAEKLDRPTPSRIRVTTDLIRMAAAASSAVAASAPATAKIGSRNAELAAKP